MNKALIGAVIMAVGLANPALAQQLKQGVLKVALNRQYEYSTNFTASKMVWTTKKDKITEKTIIAGIGRVLKHNFSDKAQLILERGMLSGFENPMEGAETVNYPVFMANRGVNQAEIEGQILPGKAQPLGWIFVRDQTGGGYVFVDVTRFFKIEVHECYDCFYLNSFITDTTLKFGATEGPPCCSGTSGMTKAFGKDRYYMCLEFDNTTWNEDVDGEYFPVVTADGVELKEITAEALDPKEDGITPNMPPFLGSDDTYVLRFRVCGIMKYEWNIKEDTYVGTGNLPVYGYGFVKKVCSMIDGKISVSEYLTTGKNNKVSAPEDAYKDSTDILDLWGLDEEWPYQWRYTFYYDSAPYYLEGDTSN